MGFIKKLGADAGLAAMRAVESMVRGRGPAYAVSLGRSLGWLAWSVAGRRRRLSLRNAAVVLPHLTPAERRGVLYEAALGSFAYWPEPLTYAFRGPHHIMRTVTVEGVEHLDAALARGRGVAAPSIHMGIFPLMAIWMTQAGYDFQFLSRFPHDDRISEVMARARAKAGVKLIRDLPRRECLVNCRATLGRGGTICFQLDQRAMGYYPAVEVPFFGRPFRAFGGMVSLALKEGAAILPMYIHREGGIRHRLVIEPEVTPEAGLPRKEAVRDVVVKLLGRFEAWVLAHPEQWWWPRSMWAGV